MIRKHKKRGLCPAFVCRFGVDSANPANATNSAGFLLPVTFDQHPAVTTMLPAMGDPDRTGMRGTRPVAVDPNIAVAIPTVIAVDPDPAVMRWTIMDLDDGVRRRHAYDDSHLRQCSSRRETDSKQQRQCSFLHRDFALHGKVRSTRIGMRSGRLILSTPWLQIRCVQLKNCRIKVVARG